MIQYFDSLKRLALESGMTCAEMIEVSVIPFDESLHNMCAMNTCGNYGKSHTCPPGVGNFHDLKAKLNTYKHGLIVQSVFQLEDSFDYEGMMKAKDIYQNVLQKTVNEIKRTYPEAKFLALGAGGCMVCAKCSYQDKEPCRHPDKAISSIEAHGIYVNKMLDIVGLKYNNGEATVSYVGVIFFT